MRLLKLEILDFTDDSTWRWRLVDAQGAFLADREVSLDSQSIEFDGYRDLYGFLRWNAMPGMEGRATHTLVQRLADWIRVEVWGSLGDVILRTAAEEPVVIHVEVPPAAKDLLFRPFELGLILDSSPGALDASIVFGTGEAATASAKADVGTRLRMLAIFSTPTDQTALNVRRERHELRKLIQRVVHGAGRAIELRVLQYGVTREVLEAVLEDGEGWDLIHFSGHGLPAGLLLEKDDGSADVIHSEEFSKLLWPARERLKLVTLSSCESGAAAMTDAMQLLGVENPTQPREARVEDGVDDDVAPLPAVAHSLCNQLGCAAVAMRYPVDDDFAIKFSDAFYEGMLGRGQSLVRAFQRALTHTAPADGDRAIDGLSLATPALFGAAALDLELVPPTDAPEPFDPNSSSLAHFEPEPETFVGRVGPLARATAALAPRSDYNGVLFHGMAGAGKTACALELAYRHEDLRFEGMAWHRAPSEGHDIKSALAYFAGALEMQLKGFELAHVVDDEDKLSRFLPRLRKLLADRSLLIVLDNIESLLTDDGQWRDERWELLMKPFLEHGGLSRLVLTSRTLPVQIQDNPAIRTESIHSLSAGESVLLTRQLPNLGRLMSADSSIGQPAGRNLVRQTLEMVQGNPKLIELADRQAADAPALRDRVEEATEEWTSKANLNVFFSRGEPDTQIGGDDFLRIIERWTKGIAGGLPTASRLCFQTICCLEPADRYEFIVPVITGLVWKELGHEDEELDVKAAIAEIERQGLIDVEAGDAGARLFRLHPAVEHAGRREVDAELRAAVDKHMAEIWSGTYRQARDEGDTSLIARAGLAGAPYLLRTGNTESAAIMIGAAVLRDSSPRTFAAALPQLERAASEATDDRSRRIALGTLLRVQAKRSPSDVVDGLYELLDLAEQAEDFSSATVVAMDLINALLAVGRTSEAWEIIEKKPRYTDLAELGPWSRMNDEGVRLRIMLERGEQKRVLEEIEPLRERMEATPIQGSAIESAAPWSVREGVLGTAFSAAVMLQQWESALELNAAVIASMEDRGAPQFEIELMRINNFSPLLALDRLASAESELRRSRAAAESAEDLSHLGKVFSSWARLESRRGHPEEAIAFERQGLRLDYSVNGLSGIRAGHNNLAGHLSVAKGDPQEIMAHRLAAALITYQTTSGEYERDLALAVASAIQHGTDSLPASYVDLCEILERVEGVAFQRVFDRLPPRAEGGEAALETVAADLGTSLERYRSEQAQDGDSG